MRTRFRERDVPWDHGHEGVLIEEASDLGDNLIAQRGFRIVHGHEEALNLQSRVVIVLDTVDGAEHRRHCFHGEELTLYRDYDAC